MEKNKKKICSDSYGDTSPPLRLCNIHAESMILAPIKMSQSCPICRHLYLEDQLFLKKEKGTVQ